MALINLFKKRKKPEAKEEKPKEKLAEPVKKPKEIKEEKPSRDAVLEKRPQKIKEKKVSEAYRILKVPQITEKATGLVGKNQYIFKVYSRANKIEIKKAIENLYGVNVLSVKIIKVPAKKRRLGRQWGWRLGYKKAIIRIKEGQKIEVLPR